MTLSLVSLRAKLQHCSVFMSIVTNRSLTSSSLMKVSEDGVRHTGHVIIITHLEAAF